MKLFIFGSTGDLVKRKIIPAFQELKVESLEIIALGRKDFTHEEYHKFVCEGDCFGDFKHKPKYEKVDFNDELVCINCGQFLEDDSVNYFYSAMPPKNIASIFRYLGNLKREGYQIKALIEKPFGENLKDAISLKELAIKENIIENIFISDHYLFKEEILDLENKDFKKIKLVSFEKVGLENRVGYYDDVGALNDMVQSHLLNIVFKLLKNPEKEFENFEIEKYEMGQYKSYLKELGKDSKTETFVNIKIKTKNKEMAFITGKKFDKKKAFIEIDGERIDFISEKNSYAKLFLDFFKDNKENFVTMDLAILAWQISEKIKSKKAKIKIYEDYSKWEDFCD